MKLILAVVNDSDDADIIGELVAKGFRVTRLASTGGFFRRGNVTLMIGAEEAQVPELMETLRAAAPVASGGEHSATVFVLPASGFTQV